MIKNGRIECDRCWKPIEAPEKPVDVKNKHWVLQFCTKCAEETGNLKRDD